MLWFIPNIRRAPSEPPQLIVYSINHKYLYIYTDTSIQTYIQPIFIDHASTLLIIMENEQHYHRRCGWNADNRKYTTNSHLSQPHTHTTTPRTTYFFYITLDLQYIHHMPATPPPPHPTATPSDTSPPPPRKSNKNTYTHTIYASSPRWSTTTQYTHRKKTATHKKHTHSQWTHHNHYSAYFLDTCYWRPVELFQCGIENRWCRTNRTL